MALLTKWLLEAYFANHTHLVQPKQERGTRGQPHVITTWAPVAVCTPRQIIDARHYNLGARDRTYTPADHRRMRLRGNVYCSSITDVKRRYTKHCNVNKMADLSGLGPGKFITLLTL